MYMFSLSFILVLHRMFGSVEAFKAVWERCSDRLFSTVLHVFDEMRKWWLLYDDWNQEMPLKNV